MFGNIFSSIYYTYLMRFNSKTHEKERILKLLEKFYSSKNLELEAIIHGIGSQYKLTYHNFDDTYRRLEADPDLASTKIRDVLDIYFEPTTKYQHIRVSILGEGSIKNYCSTNSLEHIKFNVKFIKKHNYYIDNEIGRVDVTDYHVRFNLKTEEELSSDSEIIKQLLKDWDKLPKMFRRKQHHSFVTNAGDFKFDLSIVRNSTTRTNKMTIKDVIQYRKQSLVVKPKDIEEPFSSWWQHIKSNNSNTVEVTSQPVYYQRIENSNVLTNPEKYEIEVELIKPKEEVIDIKSKFLLFVQHVGTVLQSVQGSYYIMAETEKRNVIKNYQKMVDNYSRNLFHGPLARTLKVQNMKQYPELSDADTIRHNYVVTDKADGDRCLLYVNTDNKVYLISRGRNNSNSVMSMGCSFVNHANTLLDGEYITVDVMGNEVSMYLFQDVYYHRGKDVRNQPLGVHEKQANTRQNIMYSIEEILKGKDGLVSQDATNPFVMHRKKYYRGEGDDIFEMAHKILLKVDKLSGGLLDNGRNLFSYNVNGLIFMPTKLGVGQNYANDNIGVLGIKPWLRIYKWQSPKRNSIDFRIKMRRDLINKEIVTDYHNGAKFKQVFLQVIYHPTYHNDYYGQRVLNENLKYIATDQHINFEPIYPFDGNIDVNGNLVNNAQIASIATNQDGDLLTLEGDVIQEGNIVEFIYDNSEPETKYRWKPYRIRRNIVTSGFHTANDIWETLQQPISTRMIISGETPNNTLTPTVMNNNYIGRPINIFQNYIKNKLLQIATDDVSEVNLMDFTCGKIGDITRWKNNKVKFVVAIDDDPHKIHNPIDGACARVLKQTKKEELKKLAKNIVVINGDVNQNISNGEAGLDILNKYYLNVLYGNQEVGGIGSKLERLYGKAQSKFDVITANLGKSFKDMNTIDNYMANIAENLKPNGKFIGVMLDGQTVFNELINKEKIEGFTDKKELIWKIQRDYSQSALYPKNHYSMNHQIVKYVDSLSYNEHEYLVHFDFLTDMANKIGLKLLDSKMFDEEPTSFYKTLEVEYPNMFAKVKQHKSVYKFLSMHRWFVFVKSKSKIASQLSDSAFPSSVFKISDTSGTNEVSGERESVDIDSEPVKKELLPEDVNYEESSNKEISDYNPYEFKYTYNSATPSQKTSQKSSQIIQPTQYMSKKQLKNFRKQQNKLQRQQEQYKPTVKPELNTFNLTSEDKPGITLTLVKKPRKTKKNSPSSAK